MKLAYMHGIHIMMEILPIMLALCLGLTLYHAYYSKNYAAIISTSLNLAMASQNSEVYIIIANHTHCDIISSIFQ